jgi:hypothetical protein
MVGEPGVIFPRRERPPEPELAREPPVPERQPREKRLQQPVVPGRKYPDSTELGTSPLVALSGKAGSRKPERL